MEGLTVLVREFILRGCLGELVDKMFQIGVAQFHVFMDVGVTHRLTTATVT